MSDKTAGEGAGPVGCGFPEERIYGLLDQHFYRRRPPAGVVVLPGSRLLSHYTFLKKGDGGAKTPISGKSAALFLRDPRFFKMRAPVALPAVALTREFSNVCGTVKSLLQTGQIIFFEEKKLSIFFSQKKRKGLLWRTGTRWLEGTSTARSLGCDNWRSGRALVALWRRFSNLVLEPLSPFAGLLISSTPPTPREGERRSTRQWRCRHPRNWKATCGALREFTDKLSPAPGGG